jgi:hypothetical protein
MMLTSSPICQSVSSWIYTIHTQMSRARPSSAPTWWSTMSRKAYWGRIACPLVTKVEEEHWAEGVTAYYGRCVQHLWPMRLGNLGPRRGPVGAAARPVREDVTWGVIPGGYRPEEVELALPLRVRLPVTREGGRGLGCDTRRYRQEVGFERCDPVSGDHRLKGAIWSIAEVASAQEGESCGREHKRARRTLPIGKSCFPAAGYSLSSVFCPSVCSVQLRGIDRCAITGCVGPLCDYGVCWTTV